MPVVNKNIVNMSVMKIITNILFLEIFRYESNDLLKSRIMRMK